SEIRYYQSIIHRERCHAASNKFQRLIVRAITANGAHESERNVFGTRTGLHLTGEYNGNRLRNTKPDLSGDHRRREIGRANANRKSVERTTGNGVAVCTDYEVTRQHASAFARNLKTDAVALIKKLRTKLRSKFPYAHMKPSRTG